MTSQSELNWRAALCRQLAKQEPANRALRMAEAENWLRLSKEKLRCEAAAKINADDDASVRRHVGLFQPECLQGIGGPEPAGGLK
jgi:hypothetical protein